MASLYKDLSQAIRSAKKKKDVASLYKYLRPAVQSALEKWREERDDRSVFQRWLRGDLSLHLASSACRDVIMLLMASTFDHNTRGRIEIIFGPNCKPEAYMFGEGGDKTVLCGPNVHRPRSWPRIDPDDLPAIVSRLLLLASLDTRRPDLKDISGHTKHQLGLTAKFADGVVRYRICIEHWFPSLEEIVVSLQNCMRPLDETVERIDKHLPLIESKVEDLPPERILVTLRQIGKERTAKKGRTTRR